MTMSPRTVTITRRAIKCRLLFTSAAYIQIHLKLDFIMEANTMNPDQTAPKVHIVCNMGYPRRSRREGQTTKLTWSNKDYALLETKLTWSNKDYGCDNES